MVINFTQVSFKAPWITGIGTFFFFLNMLLFLNNCILITLRFYLRPGSFMHSFTDQVESLFAPAFVSTLFLFNYSTIWIH